VSGVPPILAGDAVYLNNAGEVFALNATTGASLWHYPPPTLASPSDQSVSTGAGLVFAPNSLRLNALRIADGTLAWHTEYHGLVDGPSFANGVLYLSVSSGPTGTLYALHASDGSSMWSVPLSGNAAWPAVLAGGTLYQSRSDAPTGTPAGYIYALNPASGAVVWKYAQNGVGFTNAIVA